MIEPKLYVATFLDFKIRIWTLKNREKTLIAERKSFDPNYGCSFCCHESVLYDAVDSDIFKTLEDKEGKNPVKKTFNGIHAICSHNGNVYISTGWHDPGPGNCPSEVNEYKSFKDDLSKTIMMDDAYINALCSYEDELYTGEGRGMISKIPKIPKNNLVYPEEDITKRPSTIHALCVHDGDLYDATCREIFKTLEDKEGKNPIITKPSIKSLCSHNGVLFSGSWDGKIFDVLEDKLVYDFFDERVMAMISYDLEKK